MLAKRIIPCLDVKEGSVVKGVQFRNHMIVGDIISLSKRYIIEGADELVFYDITASAKNTVVNTNWISQVAQVIDIPFCVAGGIKNVTDVKKILSSGADKVSINSPAINNPNLITKIADQFGSQCVVVGIDSWFDKVKKKYFVCQYTGCEILTKTTNLETKQWITEVQERGAGEIVLNVMNQDGRCNGYDLEQLQDIESICHVPLIASGGAGSMSDFYNLFNSVNVSGALAASVFHKNIFTIHELKNFLNIHGIRVRLC